MIPYPQINPELVRIGPFAVRWYGLMYLLGFMAAYLLIPRQRKAQNLGLKGEMLQDLIFWLALGVIVGGRLGYILFYQYGNLYFYLTNPLEIIAVWHGGMSFHGGFIGSVLAGYRFSVKKNLSFVDLADCVMPVVPIGLGLGRIGNFINGELYGRPTDVPWAMVFPNGGPVPRHPSQLYEALGEGLLLFVLLWSLQKRNLRPGIITACFIIGYGLIRFFLEFFREPDPQIGFIMGIFTMGQVLCGAMIVLGSGFLIYCLRYKN
ncbi:MAG: prolipoprotein diacylglyceryl transferase [Syntrophobacterales bacterium]|nr:prolipoprotein diacylglyceryl transferase [Syntrophobacterales bacterium]